MSGRVPADLETEGFKWLLLIADERRALERVRALLARDLRFEHLSEGDTDDATWRFVCAAHDRRSEGLIKRFVSDHAREPEDCMCYFPVELLSVRETVEIYGVRLFPSGAVEQPGLSLGPLPAASPGSCVLAAPCTGTNRARMVERARVIAEHALRVLRATLREARFMPDEQLRFRLGEAFWFADSVGAGWAMSPGAGWDLELDEALLSHAVSQEISTLPHSPTNDVERRAHLALRWFDRAQLAVDPILELLYLFFALEAILSDSSEGLKGAALAVRRAVLALFVNDGFTHPARTFVLYDRVRSAAVHGEEPPMVSRREVDTFAWDVRQAINEFLLFARSNGFTRRARVRKALDTDPRRQQVVDGLLKQDPELWGKVL